MITISANVVLFLLQC